MELSHNTNILFSTGCLHSKISGIYHSLQQTVSELDNRGYTVSIVGTCQNKQQQIDTAWQGNVRAFIRKGPFSLHYAPEAKDFINKSCHAWSVVSMQGIWLYLHAYVASWCLKNNKPFMLTTHGGFNQAALQYSKWKKMLANLTFMRSIFKNVTCYQALTQNEYKIMREYGIKTPICVIGNGINIPKKISKDVYASYIPKKFLSKRVCLYIGRLAPIKGLERLISAWRKLNINHDWQLVIAGSGQESYELRLKDLANSSPQKNIHFIGSIYDELKDAWLRHADFMVLPSFSEAFPMAVLEGLAYECPCLLTDACGLLEIESFNAGIEVQSNEDAIIDGLSAMCSKSQQDLQLMGRNGLQLIHLRYTWQHIVDELEKVYAWLQGHGEMPDCVYLT